MARDSIAVDWAIATKGAIEGAVRSHFPADVRRWPLMHPCRYDAFAVGDSHFVLVLHDQVGGAMWVGGNADRPFPHRDHPLPPRGAQDAQVWQEYLNRTLRLRPDDAAIILPLRDSGMSSAASDYDRFTQPERELWSRQVQLIVERQAATFATKPAPTTVTNYHVTGPNARITVGGTDMSTNVVNDAAAIFEAVRTAVREGIATADRKRVMAAIESLEKLRGKPGAMQAYRDFMDLAAAHVTVLQPFFAPLAALLF